MALITDEIEVAMVEKWFPNTAKTNQGGFTLLEVLISMLIATIGLLGLAMMQGTAIQANSHASHFTQASLLAQRTIEDLNSAYLDPTNVTVTALTIGSNGNEVGVDETGAAGGIFTRIWNVAANTNFSRIVTVTVTWNDIQGVLHQVAMSTVTRGRGN